MNRSGKILMRFTGAKPPPDKGKIFELLIKDLKLPLTALKQTSNGYNAFTEYESDVEKLLTPQAADKLKEMGLEVRLPPKIKAQRSIICRQLDPHVGANTADDLKKEIERCNDRLKVAEVIKFGTHTHVMKIEFTESGMAHHALENGILAFNVKISSRQIKKEEHIDLLMCFKCYQLEKHTTNECPTPDLIICSECSGNHNYRDCKSLLKKCINCKGNHRTMAMACPLKKEMIRTKKVTKEEDKRTKEESTYAKIVQKTIEKVQKQDQTTELKSIMQETGMRAYIMILDAHMYNMIEPGSYTERLNETLTSNGFDKVILKNIPKSDKLFSCGELGNTLIQLREINKESTKKNDDVLDDESSSTTSKGSLSGMEDVEEDDDTQDSEIISRHIEKEGILEQTADEIEVQIVVQDGINKHKDLTPRGVKQLYEKGQLKYIIRSNSNYTTELVQHLIEKEKIKESRENIKYLSTTQFKKTRNGPERSPLKDDSKKQRSDLPPELPK
jgi:hypothetical protein